MHKDLQELLISKFYLKLFIIKKVRNVTLKRPGRIDPHIGIMVKTPKTHLNAHFRPQKIIDFYSRTLILSMEIIVINIYNIDKQFKWVLGGFYRDPNEGVNSTSNYTKLSHYAFVFCLCVFGLPHMQEEDFFTNCTYALVIRVLQYYCPIIV
jgi:hypothetical protein